MNKPKKDNGSRYKYYRKCVICGRKQTPGSNVHLFKPPLDPLRCRLWLEAIGEEELVYIPIEKLHQVKRVCNSHFLPEDYTLNKTRLKQTAVPSLNLKQQKIPEYAFRDFPHHIHPDRLQQFNRTQHVLQDITNINTELMKTSPKGTVQQIEDQISVIPGEGVPGPSHHPIIHEQIQTDSQERAVIPGEGVPGPSHLPIIHEHIQIDSQERPDTLAIPGPSTGTVVNVKSYKRTQKSSESKDSHEIIQDRLLCTSEANLKNIAKSPLVIDCIESTVLQDLINAAVTNEKRKLHGKRWTMETKVWALAIFKRSPKTYRFLQASLPLPSPKTLTRLLNSVPMEPGINHIVLGTLRDKVMNMKDIDKFCCILFDEMSLKKRLFYNEGTDKVEGFVDFGYQERTNNIADHVLVFMVQGLAKKYKQPIAYYFVQGTISSAKLSVIIKDIITTVNSTGLKVVNTVCDQGPTNVGALTLLRQAPGQNVDTNYFYVNNQKIYIIFDVPHLFKSIRNNFFNAGEMVYDGKTAKWAHLKEAEAKNKNFLNFPKINQTVIHPTFKIKMKVKYAAHALSNTMSAVLKMLSWKDNNDSILQTAEVIEDLDKLFDITNGPKSKKDVKKGIRTNVSAKSNHVEEWRKFLNKISQIKFQKNDSQLMLRNVRCLNGYKTTLKSLNDIWFYLQKEKFRYLNLRQINQDALENMFSVIRQHGIANSNPTCTLFTAAIKSYLVSGWTSTHSRGSNCEADGNKLLFNYRIPKISKKNKESEQNKVVSEVSDDDVPVLSLPEYEDIVDKLSFENFEEQPIVYVSGYVAKKLLNKSKDCHECKKYLVNGNPDGDEMYKYISFKEWWPEKKSLTYPSRDLCIAVKTAKDIFVKDFSQELFVLNVSERCKTQFLAKINMNWFLCNKHNMDIPLELFKILAILFIRKECKIQNNKLSLSENKSADAAKIAQQQSLQK